MRRVVATVTAFAAATMLFGAVAEPASAGTPEGPFSCWTYPGTFMDSSNSPLGPIPFSQGPEECFGIAPSGTIWHAWPGSGGWVEMPNHGRAVLIVAAYDWPGQGKALKVQAASGSYWCTYDDYLTNTWDAYYGVSAGESC